MKSTSFKALLTAALITSFGLAQAQILTQSLNSNAIYPFGTAFSPTGQFAAMGESGGAPGPTVTGCDLYGFRAQLSLGEAINIGVHQYTFGANNTPATLPIILTNTNKGLGIVEENALPTTFDFGCGNLLAVFKQSSSSANNNVLSIFGSATALGGTFNPSDRTLKRDIEPIENALEMVSQLKGYTYEYRREERPELNLPKGRRYGFITQEVQTVMPSIVRQADDINGKPTDFQVMEYDAIIPVLAEAINMQQDIIADLEKQNDALEARLARLEALILKDGATKTGSSSMNSALDIANGVELGQNRPNPSNGTTVIEYTLPKDMTNASLVVFDLNGREMSSQRINDQNGTVELNTRNWSSGVYLYTVVVDGRTVARKKMTVQ